MLAGPLATAARSVPRSRALSLLAWLLCLLLGPGPALSALHFAVVAHRVCAEHGALEHVGADTEALEREAAQAGSARGATPDDGPALAPGRGQAEGHGHESCGVAGASSNVAGLPPEPASVQALWLPFAPAHSGAERAHQGIALLHYAPKLAPPAHT